MNRVFTTDVIAKLLAARVGPGTLAAKRQLLLSIGTPSFPAERMSRLSELVAERDAWDRYIKRADERGFVDADIEGRLRGKADAGIRGALAECRVCWFYTQELGVEPAPRPSGRDGSLLDGRVPHALGRFDYEVKAPCTHDPSLRTWTWNDADTLTTVMKKANSQFRDDHANVVMIVPELQTPVALDRYQLIEAFIGEAGWIVNAPLAAGAQGSSESAFFPNGAFVRPVKGTLPAYTRISAVVVIEERLVWVPPPKPLTEAQTTMLREILAQDPRPAWPKELSDAVFARDGVERHHEVEFVVHVVHNPNATHPLDESIFARYPQLVRRGSSGSETMEWTDGRSIVGWGNNTALERHVDLERLGRKLGVLADWEELAK